jgi:hypothetical protein
VKLALLICAALVLAGCASAARRPPRVVSPVALQISAPSCPAQRPQAASLDVATSRFVRPGAVRLRLCRYASLNWGGRPPLTRDRVIDDRGTIARLIRALNRLRTPHGTYYCLMDDGSEILLLFGYADGGPARVVVELSGCRFATNGRSSRWTTPRLDRRLRALTR